MKSGEVNGVKWTLWDNETRHDSRRPSLTRPKPSKETRCWMQRYTSPRGAKLRGCAAKTGRSGASAPLHFTTVQVVFCGNLPLQTTGQKPCPIFSVDTPSRNRSESLTSRARCNQNRSAKTLGLALVSEISQKLPGPSARSGTRHAVPQRDQQRTTPTERASQETRA